MKTNLRTLTKLSTLLCSAALATLLSTTPALADGHGDHGDKAKSSEPAKEQSFDLSELTCWDVMTLEEAERGTVLFLYYGYVSGVKNELVHDGATITKVLTTLGEHCNENPDDNLLKLMTK